MCQEIKNIQQKIKKMDEKIKEARKIRDLKLIKRLMDLRLDLSRELMEYVFE